jgi:hypothetical protein
MEKLIIIGLLFLFGSVSMGNYTPDKPVKLPCKAEKAIRPTDKVAHSHCHYVIKDYDPR